MKEDWREGLLMVSASTLPEMRYGFSIHQELVRRHGTISLTREALRHTVFISQNKVIVQMCLTPFREVC